MHACITAFIYPAHQYTLYLWTLKIVGPVIHVSSSHTRH